MFEGIAPLPSGLNHEHEALFDLLLPAEFREIWGPEGNVEGGLGGLAGFLVKVLRHLVGAENHSLGGGNRGIFYENRFTAESWRLECAPATD